MSLWVTGGGCHEADAHWDDCAVVPLCGSSPCDIPARRYRRLARPRRAPRGTSRAIREGDRDPAEGRDERLLRDAPANAESAIRRRAARVRGLPHPHQLPGQAPPLLQARRCLLRRKCRADGSSGHAAARSVSTNDANHVAPPKAVLDGVAVVAEDAPMLWNPDAAGA